MNPDVCDACFRLLRSEVTARAERAAVIEEVRAEVKALRAEWMKGRGDHGENSGYSRVLAVLDRMEAE